MILSPYLFVNGENTTVAIAYNSLSLGIPYIAWSHNSGCISPKCTLVSSLEWRQNNTAFYEDHKKYLSLQRVLG